MEKNFKKIRKKYILAAAVKSVICGLAGGLLVAGALLLAFKLGAVNIDIVYYVIAGVGAGALTGGIVFLVAGTAPKKVARQVDNRYSLNERTQTALAFGGEQGDIVELQRADAEERLGELSVPVITFSGIWKHLVALLLAVAVAVAGIAIPSKAALGQSGQIDDNAPAQITEAQLIRLGELIENVKSSKLAESHRNNIVNSLTAFKNSLVPGIKYGALRTGVDGVRQQTFSTGEQISTYALLSNYLAAGDEPELAGVLTGGGNTYLYYDALTAENTETFYNEKMYDGVEDGIDYSYKLFRNLFVVAETESGGGEAAPTAETEGTEGEEDKDHAQEIRDKLFLANSLILGAVIDSAVEMSDALCTVILDFIGEFETLSAGNDNEDVLQRTLNDVFGRYQLKIINELCTQTYGMLMCRYVRNALEQIFNLGNPLELAQTRPADGGSQGGESSGGQSEGGSTGGSGTGDMNFGSADEIYDPFTGTYRKYGDVLAEYYAIVEEMLGGGEITEEQKNAVKLYFDILFGTENAGNS